MKSSDHYLAKAKDCAWKAVTLAAAALAILAVLVAGAAYHNLWVVLPCLFIIGPVLSACFRQIRDACHYHKRSLIELLTNPKSDEIQ